MHPTVSARRKWKEELAERQMKMKKFSKITECSWPGMQKMP